MMQIDPAWFSGPASSVFVLIGALWFFRYDVNKRNDQDREERIKTQQLHKDSITELKDTVNKMVESHQQTILQLGTNHQQVSEKILAKAEETERLSERRYEMLLTKTLVQKNDPPLTSI